ncbi:MAG: DUF1573 domain-containing protein [Saprospiraceae bacterium]|nr:DUF1573 domain-containing protein [Saprospiraceae bacterium]
MKNTKPQLFAFVFFLFLACSAGAQNLPTGDNSLNAGKVSWTDRQLKTGAVPFGEPVVREFWLKNTSSENLILLRVNNSCSCLKLEWPESPIAPGQSARIKATYDSQKEGDFYRLFTVQTNFDPNQSVPFALSGKVEKRMEASRN